MKKKDIVKKLQDNDVELAPIDKETADRIKRAAEATNSNAMSVIHEAMKIFEKSLGREIILRKPNSRWDATITKYTKYQSITTFEPEKTE